MLTKQEKEATFRGSKLDATLAGLLGTRVQGALVRSRFQNISEMDAPSKFLFGLAAGQELRTFPAIRRRAAEFYTELYANEPQVSAGENVQLAHPLTALELLNTLQGMQSGKAPGMDGLPVGFYGGRGSARGPN